MVTNIDSPLLPGVFILQGANAATLAGQTDIDGFLVGGASLKPEVRQIAVHLLVVQLSKLQGVDSYFRHVFCSLQLLFVPQRAPRRPKCGFGSKNIDAHVPFARIIHFVLVSFAFLI